MLGLKATPLWEHCEVPDRVTYGLQLLTTAMMGNAYEFGSSFLVAVVAPRGRYLSAEVVQ